MPPLIADKLASAVPGVSLTWSEFRWQARLTLQPSDSLRVFQALHGLGMDMLIDVTAVDYLEYAGAKQRFEVVYALLNSESGERLLVSLFVDEPDLDVASVYPIWKSADWLEREVFDMFGIRFVGHPNLKRLLMPEQFVSFPLRKDYPMQGRGERHNFPVITRAES